MPVPYEVDFSQFELSEEQKFMFDLKGYLVIPNVLSPEQVESIRKQVVAIHEQAKDGGLNAAGGASNVTPIPGGPSEAILTNPVVKGTLKELIGPDLRMDSVFSVVRHKGEGDFQGPHQGGPMRNPHFHYHFTEGRSYSGLTRMVVELNPVGPRDGGTIFLPGSHKANLPIPEAMRQRRDWYDAPFEAYEAPAGSLVFFSENTCHAGPAWQNPDYPRIAILFAFCDIGMRWHRHSRVPDEVIQSLGPEARWFFRDIWPWDNNGGAYNGRNVIVVEDDGSITVSP